MAKKKTGPQQQDKQGRRSQDYSGDVDAFSRINGEVMRKFDELADANKRSRSAQIAWLVEQFVDDEYPKLLARRKAATEN